MLRSAKFHAFQPGPGPARSFASQRMSNVMSFLSSISSTTPIHLPVQQSTEGIRERSVSNTLGQIRAPTRRSIESCQLSMLLLVVTEHQHYNLYEDNCYRFAGMVFEAPKTLLPGYQESCYKQDDRGRCHLNLPMLAAHNIPKICEKYSFEWEQSLRVLRVGPDGVDRQVSFFPDCSIVMFGLSHLQQEWEQTQQKPDAAESRCKRLDKHSWVWL